MGGMGALECVMYCSAGECMGAFLGECLACYGRAAGRAGERCPGLGLHSILFVVNKRSYNSYA